jgi:predicted regulator of Ras-like GTPase activity (Roadblock/LC7/MglB family)
MRGLRGCIWGQRRKMAEGSASVVDQIQQVLEDLLSLSGEIGSAVVLSEGGEIKGSTLAPGVDRERYAAMIGALAGIARRVARENGGAGFAQVRIGEEGGYVLLVGLGRGYTLAATTGPDARVGLVLYDMRNTAKEFERVLGFEEGGQR